VNAWLARPLDPNDMLFTAWTSAVVTLPLPRTQLKV